MATKHCIRDVHARIFHKLLDVIPDLMTIEESGKSVVDGFMDLNLDILHRQPDRIIIALSHYYRHPSGDMIADLDMEIAVYPQREMAEALAYQDCWGYRRVYGEDGATVDVRAKRELNGFLNQWLTNLIQQGHRIQAQLCREGATLKQDDPTLALQSIAKGSKVFL
jgi:uncharacterized protein YqiB (DUF1249 family)